MRMHSTKLWIDSTKKTYSGMNFMLSGLNVTRISKGRCGVHRWSKVRVKPHDGKAYVIKVCVACNARKGGEWDGTTNDA